MQILIRLCSGYAHWQFNSIYASALGRPFTILTPLLRENEQYSCKWIRTQRRSDKRQLGYASSLSLTNGCGDRRQTYRTLLGSGTFLLSGWRESREINVWCGCGSQQAVTVRMPDALQPRVRSLHYLTVAVDLTCRRSNDQREMLRALQSSSLFRYCFQHYDAE